MASGTNTARISTDHSNDATNGCWSGHASAGGMAALVLPNSSRAAWVTADVGFHSATTWSGPGRFELATNVLARNESGRISRMPKLLKASGVRMVSATVAITHEIA